MIASTKITDDMAKQSFLVQSMLVHYSFVFETDIIGQIGV